ncbi:MAG: response regulator transcription factor [Acidobacteriaceae bacterium]
MRIILADNQAIYRSGLARVLRSEVGIEVVALCGRLSGLQRAIRNWSGAIAIFPSSFTAEIAALLDTVKEHGNRAVMILEPKTVLESWLVNRADGVLSRSVAEPQLLECLYRVEAGERYVQRAVVESMVAPDPTPSRVLQRLTQRELRIVALICEGRKNKEIAQRLNTKEQSVKNYLRSIYSKMEVGDRLELAIFAMHHEMLAEMVRTVWIEMANTA